ncbi:MAG: hypothetical protein EAX86_09980 [Candidatus Heimdallarchaeota archaeon]|nr:hypothetical protein [Candidatus Heimdallarchaeota archaeon]
MNPITITQDLESLKIASKILVDLFSSSDIPNITENEWVEWKNWFLSQESKFRAGTVSIPTYFTQVKRIHAFLIEKTSLEENDLFFMEIMEREKVYDLTEIKHEKPEQLSEEEFDSFAEILFSFYTQGQSDLKANPQIEKLVSQKKNRFFERDVILNIEDEIAAIKAGDYKFNSEDEKFCLLGELFLQNGDLETASNNFEAISAITLKNAKLISIALAKRNLNWFKILLPKAYPETFELESSGRYILSFLIANEWFYRYDVDSTSQRCISFVLSSGIYQISKMDVFRAFIEDIRISTDGRLGLWGIKAEKMYDFKIENVRHLDFKQRIGWRAI